jgi:hypothetical protein
MMITTGTTMKTTIKPVAKLPAAPARAAAAALPLSAFPKELALAAVAAVAS